MNIAYIVQCHKNSVQINMLLKELISNGADVYIHLDKKSQEIREEILTNKHIFLIKSEECVDVCWGSYSQCEASLVLINAVLQSGREYDYVCLISGQDLPLMNQQEIENFLEENRGYGFIEIMSEDNPHIRRFEKRNAIYHFKSMTDRTFFSKVVRNGVYILTGGKKRTFKIFKRPSPFKKTYFGSSWWCLPLECIKEMMDRYDGDTGVKRFFEHTVCPDESLFQTLFMNTTYANKQKDILTYVDWSANASSPKVMMKQDREILINNTYKKCFARKFDIDIDRDIVDELLKKVRQI